MSVILKERGWGKTILPPAPSPQPTAHLSVVVPLASLLAGCGFHLAGSRPLPEPMNAVYIDVVQPYQVSQPPVEAALRSRLARRGASVKGSAGEARTVLRLSELKEEREVLSVDSFGKAVEYQLTVTVKYELLAGGQGLVPPGLLSVSRDYTFNAQQVLAKEAEEKRLRAFMQDELAELIMLRLESELRRLGPSG